MITPDPSQQRVLALDVTRHARVVGAPGSGKTQMLIEAYASMLGQPGWSEGDVLAIAPTRLAAARVRTGIERRARQALGGTPARTLESLAFAILTHSAARLGDASPRLLTGQVQDEAIAQSIDALLAGENTGFFAPEVLLSPVFRAELREFWRVLDDFDLEPGEFSRQLDELRGLERSQAFTIVPGDDLLDRWREALSIIAATDEGLRVSRPGELSSSALLRAASRQVRAGRADVPRLLLVDDAQEIGEGQLAFLAACAAAGSAVWVFGDPDTVTQTFHGERTGLVTNLAGALSRRHAPAEPEQVVILETVHRHLGKLRTFVSELTSRIGSRDVATWREAQAAHAADEQHLDALSVRFTLTESQSELIGIIAHHMRRHHLGPGGVVNVPWQRMAVICRSRDEALRISRGLAGLQVPTGMVAGGIVLREHHAVRDLILLLQHALGYGELDAQRVQHILSGPLGGLDPVAVRRLRSALMLHERREARDEGRQARTTDEVLLDAVEFPGVDAVVDSAPGRALRRLALVVAAGARVHAAGGTARETLWALWDGVRIADGTKLATVWQSEALEDSGPRADAADRALDAVMGLFFALQRHEEQDSAQPIDELLEQLLTGDVPEDSLAHRGERDTVVVTTPQGAIGREFDVVAVVGVQDGVWPNLRSRGSLFGTVALERWLRGEEATEPSRRDTVHDELRLFVQACSRATQDILVVAVSDEDQHPSPFFRFGHAHRHDNMPSSRLTLRGMTAAMRRAVIADPKDQIAIDSLTAMIVAGVPGAHPDDWYGVRPPSTSAALHDLDDAETRVPVSPSQIEKVETCPLDWVVSMLGGTSTSTQMNLGTLVHHAFESALSPDVEELTEVVEREWHKLAFDAEWESQRARKLAHTMVTGVSAYLRAFETSDRSLAGREAAFSATLEFAELRGKADRLEQRETADGTEVSVLDLKTGRTAPTGPQTVDHPQLLAYQLGVALGAFAVEGGELAEVKNGGASLLFVHPDVTKGKSFVEKRQEPADAEKRELFVRRVINVAKTMAAGSFEARIDHHCTDPYAFGDCQLHIIPAVSHA